MKAFEASLPRREGRSQFSHYLPRLKREFYQADSVVFWTLTIVNRREGWLNNEIHLRFRELMLHCAAREALLCPAYCLMPDHLHLVWMGLRLSSDQRNAMAFLTTHLKRLLRPVELQHQPYDHVLTESERRQQKFGVACADYVFLNPLKAGLTTDPASWSHSGAIVPGYFDVNPFELGYWQWFWRQYSKMREPGIEKRTLPPRSME